MDIINVLTAISAYFGLDITALLVIAGGITVVVNFLKVTSPFNQWVKDAVIPYVTAGLSLVVCAATMWGNWLPMIVATVLVTILSIGGWASAKMLAHKMGTAPSNSSGGK